MRLTLSSHLGQNVGLGEGYVDSFPETYNTFWAVKKSDFIRVHGVHLIHIPDKVLFCSV